VRAAHGGAHNPFHLIPLGLEFFFHHRNSGEWKLDEIAQVKQPLESLVLRFRGKGDIDRRSVNGAGAYRGQPGIFVTPAEWKERGYIVNDEARARTLPAWREWFTANIVK
jgi:hypothetical protein